MILTLISPLCIAPVLIDKMSWETIHQNNIFIKKILKQPVVTLKGLPRTVLCNLGIFLVATAHGLSSLRTL